MPPSFPADFSRRSARPSGADSADARPPPPVRNDRRRTPPARRLELRFIQHARQKTTLGEAGDVGLDASCEYLRARRIATRLSRLGQPPQLRVDRRVERRAAGARRPRPRDALVGAVDRPSPARRPPSGDAADRRRGTGRRRARAGPPAEPPAADRSMPAAIVARLRERLDAERHLLVAEDAAARHHAHAGEHVDAGGQRQVRRRRVVQRRLPARLLGAARVDAALRGQAVELADVADRGGHDRVLGRAAGEVAGLAGPSRSG